MSKISYYTQDGLNKLREKLNHLKTVERPKISKAIGDARDKGDLSENAEYDAAKEAQRILEGQIVSLEQTLVHARIIDESELDNSKALIHSKVKIQHLGNGSVTTYKLVAQSEANLGESKISVDSPIGKGLLGNKKGDIVEINVPRGKIQFKILEITR